MCKKVLVPIADGIEEIEAVTIIDVLTRAQAKVTVASVNQLQIKASRGVNITADSRMDQCIQNTYDLIALPGGMPGAQHLSDCVPLIKMLKQQKDANRLYAAICASPVIALLPHGLLEGKKATVYPSLADKLDNSSIDQPVVVDGNCITSQGPGTAMQFALKLVELLFSKQKANEIARDMIV